MNRPIMKKVSIQGIKGAFHEEAAQDYFNSEIEIIPNSIKIRVPQEIKV